MIKKIKVYLQDEVKEMIIALSAFIVICLSFTIYLKFVGIPMSKAHNLYNEALIALENDDKVKALELIDTSLRYWDDQKARELKIEINNMY